MCLCVHHTLTLTFLLGPQRFVEVFDHNYQMGSEGSADLDFVFVAFQEPDPGNTNVREKQLKLMCIPSCCYRGQLVSLLLLSPAFPFSTELDLTNCSSVQG